MNTLKSFEDFLSSGVVRKRTPDKPRARFLVKESQRDYEYLLELVKRMGVSNVNSNDYLKKCYDVIMEKLRAKMLLDGYSASGIGAHEAEVSYAKKIGFKDSELHFINQIRFFRNGALYYGTSIDAEYAKRVISFTKEANAKILKAVGGLK